MIVAGGTMALTRKATPQMGVGYGLVILAATSAVGVVLPSMLLRAGDAWTAWVQGASTGRQLARRLTEVLSLSGAASGVVIVLGIAAIIISTIQATLMFFRQAALVVLAGVLPLAAAGTVNPATRSWFRRVTGWTLALIFYKPAAAAVYATPFTMIGHAGAARPPAAHRTAGHQARAARALGPGRQRPRPRRSPAQPVPPPLAAWAPQSVRHRAARLKAPPDTAPRKAPQQAPHRAPQGAAARQQAQHLPQARRPRPGLHPGPRLAQQAPPPRQPDLPAARQRPAPKPRNPCTHRTRRPSDDP